MASILIAGLLTLVLGFAIGWLAAWVASLRATGATLSVLWGRVLAGAGVLAAVMSTCDALMLSGSALITRNLYGAWKPGSTRVSALSVARTTFVIDRKGIVQKVWTDVDVVGHADEVLEFVSALP